MAPLTTAKAAVVVRDLRKEYPTPNDPLVVLRDVNLELSRGTPLAIVGPSGSGKSTLLNILGTLDQPTGGSFTLDGVDPFTLSPKDLASFRSTKIGFIFQDHLLLPQLSAAENVLVAKLAQGKATKADGDRARQLLKDVGLADRASHLPSELSGGEQQRVAIARAMMNSPTLMLADEPTGNLDPKTAQQVADLLFDLASKTGSVLVVVTHSMELAGRFPKRMRMQDGELVNA
ncbi:ABC transporter ATP-binding protein [Humisphaera borealis]|uniref:ABC transporter ATP-binding protein n=2 Tax=Humisphaera borealis TaxID=2807512 RepID=A0A7M2X3Z9_9BACT|nr:ABC transporter ATP-binding protein [Humisphaera borealis]